MKYFVQFILSLVCFLAFVFSGCAAPREFQQHGADAYAGTRGAILILDAALKAPTLPEMANGIRIATDVMGATLPRIENAVGIPIANLPVPKMSPEAVASNPQGYVGSKPPSPPPPSPWTGGLIGGLSTAAMALLWGIGRVAPSFPGLGTAAGGIANVLWALFSTKDQKRADNIATTASDAVSTVAPILEAIALNHGSLPDSLKGKIDIQTLDALTTLATLLKNPSK